MKLVHGNTRCQEQIVIIIIIIYTLTVDWQIDLISFWLKNSHHDLKIWILYYLFVVISSKNMDSWSPILIVWNLNLKFHTLNQQNIKQHMNKWLVDGWLR